MNLIVKLIMRIFRKPLQELILKTVAKDARSAGVTRHRNGFVCGTTAMYRNAAKGDFLDYLEQTLAEGDEQEKKFKQKVLERFNRKPMVPRGK